MAMNENIESLDKEIARLSTKLSKLEPESDAYKAVRVSLDTLYKIRNDIYKVDTEDIAARDKSEVDVTQKKAEMDMRQKELDSANTKIENEQKQKADELKSANDRFNREMDMRQKELDMRQTELEAAERQHKDDIKSQRLSRVRDYVVTGITTVVKVGTTLLAAYLTFEVAKKGYQFEKDGCPTSKTFRDEMKNSIDLFKDLAKSK